MLGALSPLADRPVGRFLLIPIIPLDSELFLLRRPIYMAPMILPREGPDTLNLGSWEMTKFITFLLVSIRRLLTLPIFRPVGFPRFASFPLADIAINSVLAKRKIPAWVGDVA